MKYLKIPVLLILLLLPVSVFAQSVDSAHYEVKIGEFYGAPGDTIMMPILIRNQNDENSALFDGSIAGMQLRIVMDSLASFDDLLIPLIDAIDTNWNAVPPEPSFYYLEIETTGRGDGLIYYPWNGDPNTNQLLCYNQVKSDSLTDHLVIFYIPPFVDTARGEEFPAIPPSEGEATVCLYVPMLVNPSAQLGDYTRLYFKDYDFIDGEIENQFASGTLGEITQIILPYLNNTQNLFTVSDNDPPEIDPISPSSFSYTAGATITPVTVSATDPNGDQFCIVASDLPAGAEFGIDDEACGTGDASGTLTWSTTSADTGTHIINFMATDQQGMSSINSSVQIVVNPIGTGSSPVIANIVPSSILIEQGQSIPPVTVTATDADGDYVTLTAQYVPATAVITPSNPVSGTGSASMTINWTASFTDVGTYSINFIAQDNQGNSSATRSLVIIVNEIDEDRLYTTSTWGTDTRPTGGIPGASPVIFPIDLVTTKNVYGINFEMTYPAEIARLDSIGVTDRTPEYLVYENIGSWPDSVRVLAFGANNEVIGEGTSSAIFYAYFTIDTAAPIGDYWVHFYDAWESIDPDPEVASLQLAIDSGMIQVDRMGDVNLDGRINVDDPVKIVSYIIGTFGLPTRNYNVANVIDDGSVNVIDLVGVINLFFGDPIEASPAPMNYDGQEATLKLAYEDLTAGQYTKLNVQGEFPDEVAGIQLQIQYDPDVIDFERPEIPVALSQYRLDYVDNNNGQMNVLLTSFQSQHSGEWINAGAADIIYLPASVKQNIFSDDNTKIKISKAYLSTPQANAIPVKDLDSGPLLPANFTLYQNYPNPFNPVTTIEYYIDGVGMHDVTMEIFNILGQKVNTLVNEAQDGGRTHDATWYGDNEEGKKVATGIYFYRLQVDEYSETKKMLLLK